jgi:hypothetical protein
MTLPSNKQTYPIQAVSYLTEHHCSGNLFNSYDYGGYLIWKLPKQPVYIDGRMAIWRNNNGVYYLATYLNILKNQKIQQAQFAKYNIRCAIVTNDAQYSMTIKDLINDRWNLAVNANQSMLLIAPSSIKY